MTLWQPGMRITASRLNDFTPVALTSTPTAATNFALNTFTARKGGGVTEWEVMLTYSGTTITAGATGNITDTLACTLPADCRPGGEAYELYEVAGVTAGSVRILANGQCLLTTLYPTSSIGANSVKFSGAFVTG